MNALGVTYKECEDKCYYDFEDKPFELYDCIEACELLENGEPAWYISLLNWAATSAPGIIDAVRRRKGMTQQELLNYLRQQGYKPPGEESAMEKYLPWIIIGGIGFFGLILMATMMKK